MLHLSKLCKYLFESLTHCCMGKILHLCKFIFIFFANKSISTQNFNGLVASDNRPLPEPVVTQISDSLTHCGLVMPYGDIYLGQHWWHQAITWIDVDLSSKVFCGIHLRAISQEVLMNMIRNMCSEITLLKLFLHCLVVSESKCLWRTKSILP